MHIERLRLTDFRNYRELDIALPRGLVVFRGRNAQGKSNLLEAISLIATSRSFRTNSEREAVRWGAAGHFARVEAEVVRRKDTLDVEVIVADTGVEAPASSVAQATSGTIASPPLPAVPFRKRIRVNGMPRRAMDLLGKVTVVVFAPTHLELVTGSPSERRRFLDLTLCQVHAGYCRALGQYQKVVTQRAALLRRIKEGEESPHALPFWDEQLATLAVPLMRTRARFIAHAEGTAGQLYEVLARDEGLPEMPLRLAYEPSYKGPVDVGDDELAAAFRARLVELRRREIAQGANVLGPHRDDLAFYAGDINLTTYGSRGQQRTVALALKLAELAYIEAETGDQPLLLLDDVLSELDARRRADFLDAVSDLDQVLLTITDATSLPETVQSRAYVYSVEGGLVILEASPASTDLTGTSGHESASR
ncbi:MAG TPA: DNA replication/repair protein RecF [Ktedonobacterales bacterium]|jgi:DNA replication and repair protein RecF